MAKGVLGNDPFQRGAASRDGEPAEKAATPGSAKPARKKGAATSASAKKAAGAKAGAGRAASAKKAPAGRGRKGAAGAGLAEAAARDTASQASAKHERQPAKEAGTRTGTPAKHGRQQQATSHARAPGGSERKPTRGEGAHAQAPAKHERRQGAAAHVETERTPAREGTHAKASAGNERRQDAAPRAQAPTAPERRRGMEAGEGAHGRALERPEPRQGTAAHTEAPTGRGRPGTEASAHAEAPAAAEAEDAVLPLREPAAPVTPRAPPPPRRPVLSDEMGARTPQQREVDHALAEALAAEVAEATAKVAVEDALAGRPGQEDVDRLLATELATELAEAAVEEVLEHSPSTQRPERERELAAAVAAQVAETAAEVAVAEVLDRRAAERTGTLGDEGPVSAAAASADDEGDEDDEPGFEDTFELEAEGEDDEQEDDEDVYGERDLGLSLSVSVMEPEERDTSSLEPEVEVADGTRDEFPPGRRVPLSVVPPEPGGEGPREPFFTEQLREPEAPRPLQERAAGMLSLAKEIAGQALASEGLGRAMGAMNGLVGAARAGLGMGGGASIDEYGKDPALVQRLEPVLEFLYSQYWRVSVQGVDHVPRGAAILVANHSGALPYDGLVMSLVLTRERPDLREPRWLVEDQVFHAPVLGTLFNRLGAVRACPENALRLLDEQRPLVVFPEGYQALSKPFSERYRLKRFGRGGFVKLALRTGAPIVPVAIVGAEETSPLLGRLPASFLGLPFVPLTPLGPLPLPAKWSIRFGEPLSMEGLNPEAADDLGEVQRLTERTRESIMGMLQSLLRERRSVFAG